MPVRQLKMDEQNEGEVLDFTKPDYVFAPRGNHEWRQQGPYLICKSCEIQHGVFIGVNKQMKGIDENGQPIIKKL